MNFWQFASSSPWLTFFLVLITLSCLEGCVRAIASAFSRHPPVVECETEETTEEETE